MRAGMYTCSEYVPARMKRHWAVEEEVLREAMAAEMVEYVPVEPTVMQPDGADVRAVARAVANSELKAARTSMIMDGLEG